MQLAVHLDLAGGEFHQQMEKFGCLLDAVQVNMLYLSVEAQFEELQPAQERVLDLRLQQSFLVKDLGQDLAQALSVPGS